MRFGCFKLKCKCQKKENLNNKYRRMSSEVFHCCKCLQMIYCKVFWLRIWPLYEIPKYFHLKQFVSFSIFSCWFMCICIYIYIYILYIYIYIHLHIHRYKHTYTNTHTYTRILKYKLNEISRSLCRIQILNFQML